MPSFTVSGSIASVGFITRMNAAMLSVVIVPMGSVQADVLEWC